MKIRGKKDPTLYPEFELGNLERYAVRWADDLNGRYKSIKVEGIHLCQFNTKFEERMKGRSGNKQETTENKNWLTTKYAVIVEIAGCDDVAVGSVEFYSHENADEDEKHLRPEENYNDCENFIAEIKFAGHYSRVHPLIDEAFERSVYRVKPPGDFIREWKFIPTVKKADLKYIHSDGKTPLIYMDSVYTLYDGDQLPDAVLQTIEKAKPEIELFYENFKKEIDSSLSGADFKKKQTAALVSFKDYNNTFKLIKKTYLMQRDLYYLTGGHEKRSFVGKLLQMIVKGEFGKKLSAIKLWEAYQRISIKADR